MQRQHYGCLRGNLLQRAKQILRENEGKYDLALAEIHANATSEKLAMGYYLDGRCAAVWGTHTHVQTADERVNPKGTGYITDLGMTGPKRSVLGVTPELAIEKMRTQMPVRFQNPPGECCLQGLLVQVDKRTRRAVSVEPISL